MKIRPIILILFIAAFIAMTIRVFFIESYKIATDSMSDTHKSGVCLLVEKWTLGALIPFSHRQRVSGFGSIERNDLIVYKQPLIRPSSQKSRPAQSMYRIAGRNALFEQRYRSCEQSIIKQTKDHR